MTETAASPAALPAFCRARTLVLGVGNVLFGDDGFGPEVVRHLIDQFEIPDDIYVMDVGTGARKILFTVTLSEERPEEIVIVDAVDWGKTNGQVFEIPADALPENKIDDFSLHQVPTSNMLRELQEQCGVRVIVLACDVGMIAQEIEPGLSPAVEIAVVTGAQQIADRYGLAQVGAQLPYRPEW
ncbi:MAG TPA: hydrogenase maturation protease [Thermoleophilia bacterium]|nr:hydrogenase maturation protease [Thermoleophilia bacterium]